VCEAPNIFTALQYSSFLTTKTCPLTIRANIGTFDIPMARITLNTPDPRIVIKRIDSKTNGNAIIPSITRIIIESVIPPAYPEIKPKNKPIIPPTRVAPTATSIEILEPYNIRLKRSRPNSSVPKTCPIFPGLT